MEHSHPLLVGMEDSSEGLVLAHGTPTYVFVYELALVPVIQVDELGGTLLLPVHPGTDVLTAGLRVEVGALPVPGEDKTRPLGHCPGWRTDLRTDRELSRGQLTGIEFPSEAWHAAHTWDIKRRMGLASSNPQRPTVCAQTAFPMQMQGCLISPRLALCVFTPWGFWTEDPTDGTWKCPLSPSRQYLHTFPTAWNLLKWISSCAYTDGSPRLQEEAKPLMIEPLPCVGVIIDVVVNAMAMPLVVSPLPYKGQHTLIKSELERTDRCRRPS